MTGNLNTIRNEGYRILIQGLGVTGAVAFLRQFENGSGNYTEERQAILDENSIDIIVERIKKRNAEKF